MYTRERARKVKIHVHAYASAAEFQSSRFARRRTIVCTASCNCIRARVHARQKSSIRPEDEAKSRWARENGRTKRLYSGNEREIVNFIDFIVGHCAFIAIPFLIVIIDY